MKGIAKVAETNQTAIMGIPVTICNAATHNSVVLPKPNKLGLAKIGMISL
jgi:hypothetical protein